MSSTFGSKGPTGRVGGYNMRSVPNFTPEMMELFKSLFAHVGPESQTAKLAAGDPETFAQLEAPAMRQFSGLQGNIASRFSGMGTGARRSSGFQNTMNQASADFASDLQSKRQGISQQALRDLFGMSESLLNKRPFDTFLEPKKPSFLESIFGGLGQLGGQFGGSAAGAGGTLSILKLLGLL